MKKLRTISLLTALMALMALFACYKPKNYNQSCTDILTNRGIVTTVYPDTIYADGVSTALVIIKMPVVYDTMGSSFMLNTTGGVFEPLGLSQLVTNYSSVATINNTTYRMDTVVLRADALAALDTITYSFQGCQKVFTVRFNKVGADTLLLTSSVPYVTYGTPGSFQVTATLKNGPYGIASSHTPVYFNYVNPLLDQPTFIDSNGAVDSPGRFYFLPQSQIAYSNDSGTASITVVYDAPIPGFVRPDSLFPLSISAYTLNNSKSGGYTIPDTISIYVVR